MAFDRNAKSPERLRRAFQELAKFGQADGVSIAFTNDVYTLLLAAGNTGLDKSAGLKIVNDPAGGLSAGASGEKILLAGTTPGLALSASGLSFLVEPNGGLVAFSNGVGVLVDGTSVTLDGTGHLQTVTHGTVTSVGLGAPGIFAVSGSPVTASGTLTFTLKTQTANQVWAGPTTGVPATPTFRALVAADVPALAYVTSVGLSAPGIFTVSGSPVTASGTLALTLANQTANQVWAGPASGGAVAPTFRTLVSADLPTMVAAGASHAGGAVPDPGATSHTPFPAYLREDATWANPGQLLARSTAVGTTLNNVTVSTDLGTGYNTSILANTLTAGRVIEATWSGFFTTGAAQQVAFSVSLGGAGLQHPNFTVPVAVSTYHFRIRLEAIVYTTGAGGTYSATLHVTIQQDASSTVQTYTVTNIVALDTTVANSLHAAFAATVANNALTPRSFIAKGLN